jgi:hypothetical protein
MAKPKPKAKLLVKYLRVSELEPYARNARLHTTGQVAQIAASIERFGFTNPILVDEHGGIIAGHGRALAAAQIGMATVPTIALHGLSEAEKRAYVIADNKLTLNSAWSPENLAAELDELAADGIGADLLGFSDADLTRLHDDLAAIELASEQRGGDGGDGEAADESDQGDEGDSPRAQGPGLPEPSPSNPGGAGDPLPPEYVTFACAMTEGARAVILEAVSLAKKLEGANTTPDALVLIARRYIDGGG